ncbi:MULTISPECIES: cytochrome P450 [unclassified Streptomyces]|uniref:cytochrome P450 n=1 Tax=unclassified Streptomyces TaxID=2593676 RepID=UPI002E2F2D5B|nr:MULTISPECIES: cytochrome P450 [unclassified Streptomyces]WUC69061.1 cytochrome P450 [Streptomyces sp. NBC_00539]
MTCPHAAAGSVRTYPFGDRVDLELDPAYAELRAGEPVVRVRMPYGGEAWLLTRHADIKKASADPRLSMHAGADRDVPRAAPRGLDSVGLMGMPPESHARLRRLVSRAFTARRVAELRPRIAEITHGLIDGLIADGGPADLVQRLALPLPTAVICEMLGIPHEDRHVFRAFTEALMSSSRYTEQEVAEAAEQYADYLRGYVAKRRAQPEDDLLSALVEAHDEGGQLSGNELLMLVGGMLIGGHETTAGQLAGHVALLLRDRSRYEELRARPELVPTAVEELLRVVPLWASVGPTRIVTEDVEIGGVTLRAGEAVVYSLASANRDESVFENASDLVLDRTNNPHIAFGQGPHYCLGAPLARAELQCALEALITRLPGLRLAVPADELAWHEGMLVRGPVELPVAW